jgi:hypothetical protein
MSELPQRKTVPELPGEIYANAERTVAVAAFAKHRGLVIRRLCLMTHSGYLCSFLVSDTLASNRYFLSDLEKYPAARRALIDLQMLLSNRYGHEVSGSTLEIDFEEDLLAWRNLYAKRGKACKSLNLTLDATRDLPAIVLLPLLASIKLTQPVLCNAKLRFLLLALAGQSGLLQLMTARQEPRHLGMATIRPRMNRVVELILASSLTEITQAWSLYARRNCRRAGNLVLEPHAPLRESVWLRNYFTSLYDYTESQPTTLLSLTRKTLEWHEAIERGVFHETEAIKKQPRIDPEARVPEHPFELPEGNWRHFATVKEVRQEGKVMRHCVSSYVHKVMAAKCFLFHINDGKSDATVEYDARGNLVQAKGPRNRRNSATRLVELHHAKLRFKQKDADANQTKLLLH